MFHLPFVFGRAYRGCGGAAAAATAASTAAAVAQVVVTVAFDALEHALKFRVSRLLQLHREMEEPNKAISTCLKFHFTLRKVTQCCRSVRWEETPCMFGCISWRRKAVVNVTQERVVLPSIYPYIYASTAIEVSARAVGDEGQMNDVRIL